MSWTKLCGNIRQRAFEFEAGRRSLQSERRREYHDDACATKCPISCSFGDSSRPPVGAIFIEAPSCRFFNTTLLRYANGRTGQRFLVLFVSDLDPSGLDLQRLA